MFFKYFIEWRHSANNCWLTFNQKFDTELAARNRFSRELIDNPEMHFRLVRLPETIRREVIVSYTPNTQRITYAEAYS